MELQDNGTPLQYSCLKNPMDGGAWWAILSMGSHRVGHIQAVPGKMSLNPEYPEVPFWALFHIKLS